MSDTEKVLSYEEAKQLCMKAFNGGITYGSESIRYGVEARAYDWEHWLKENESLFKPTPTIVNVLQELVIDWDCATDGEDKEDVLKEYASKLQLAGDAE